MDSQEFNELSTRFLVSLGNDLECLRRNELRYNTREWGNSPPPSAKQFPGVKVGDTLYVTDSLSEPLGVCVVVQVFDDDTCRLVNVTDEPRSQRVAWGTQWHFRTIKEALTSLVEECFEHHGSYVSYATKVKAAIDKGDDLTQFSNGNSSLP